MSVWVPGSRVWALSCWGWAGNCKGRLPAARALPRCDPRKAEGAASWTVRVIPKHACLTLLPSFGAGGGPIVPDFNLLFAFPTQGHGEAPGLVRSRRRDGGSPARAFPGGFHGKSKADRGNSLGLAPLDVGELWAREVVSSWMSWVI